MASTDSRAEAEPTCRERPVVTSSWDGVCNVHIFRVELSGNFRTLLNNWNVAGPSDVRDLAVLAQLCQFFSYGAFAFAVC